MQELLRPLIDATHTSVNAAPARRCRRSWLACRSSGMMQERPSPSELHRPEPSHTECSTGFNVSTSMSMFGLASQCISWQAAHAAPSDTETVAATEKEFCMEKRAA